MVTRSSQAKLIARCKGFGPWSKHIQSTCAKPGPVCGGEALSPGDAGKGYVHVHAGIHGIGSLLPEERDWRNPVARIAIQRAD